MARQQACFSGGQQRLPAELFSKIFLLCDVMWCMSEENGDFLCQATVMAVCRRWRSMALNTTALWTRVRLCDAQSYSRSAIYLSRSGPTAPLDIEIDMSGLYRIGEDDALESYTKQTQYALTFIVAHGGMASRWRSLWIQTELYRAQLAAMEFLLSTPIPSLQYLEMLFSGPGEEQGDQATLDDVAYMLDTPELLFCAPPPRLRTAKLAGIPNPCLFGHSVYPKLVGLTRLELEFAILHPSLEELRKMLAVCPELVTLCLSSAGTNDPFLLWGAGAPSEEPPICLPKLRALSFSSITSSAWNLAVLTMLTAPNLDVLRITLDDFEGRYVNHPAHMLQFLARRHGVKNPQPYFPALTHFIYGPSTDPTEDLQTLLPSYPYITSLSLPRGSPLTALLKKPWLAPSLTHIRVTSGVIEDLERLVRSRHDAGIPLKTVEINWLGIGPRITSHDEKQLQKWVDSVVVTGIVDERTRIDPIDW